MKTEGVNYYRRFAYEKGSIDVQKMIKAGQEVGLEAEDKGQKM
jgi:hypothetical protein